MAWAQAIRASAKARKIGATAGFVASWLALDVVFNLRFPAPEPGPAWWCLLPSIDLTIILGGFALVGCWGRRVPGVVMAGVTLAALAVRLFRLGDGLVHEAYYRPLNLTLDVPLLPDLAGLLRSTVATGTFVLGCLGGVVVLSLGVYGIHAALTRAERHLTSGARARGGWALLILLAVGLSPLWPGGGASSRGRLGLFGASAGPGLWQQVQFALAARSLRAAKAREIAAVQARLADTPADLGKLHGADVLVFFIESYGVTVFTNPHHAARMRPVHDAFAAQLEQLHLGVVTGQSASPIQGGGSWLAHATFAAGVRIGDGLEFALLRQTRPLPHTMAWFFQQAGYRTVLVQPGTTRPWPEGEVTGFAQRYYAPQLGYQGPAFGWAPMPDQYVIDFVDRREVAPVHRPPIFAEFALVSSHAPWNLQPPVVDWAELPSGRVYHDVAPIRFPVTWQTLATGGEAYVASLAYDFEVLGQYLARLARPDTLVIVLGDHQPTAAITAAAPAAAVPVHVISGNRALLAAFVDKGNDVPISFMPGMRPPLGRPAAGMETFLVDLLQRLSHPARPGTITAVGSAVRTTTATP